MRNTRTHVLEITTNKNKVCMLLNQYGMERCTHGSHSEPSNPIYNTNSTQSRIQQSNMQYTQHTARQQNASDDGTYLNRLIDVAWNFVSTDLIHVTLARDAPALV